jgi:YidC/Oxa1 family membrane protein insertase
MSESALKAMSYGFPGLTLLFTWWLPASVQLSFFFTGALSFIQGTAFRHPTIRVFLGMVPLTPPKGPDAPYQARVVTLSPNEQTGTWEAPRGSHSAPTPSPKSTIIGGFKKEVSEAVDSIKKSGKDTVQKANVIMGRAPRKDGVLSKQEKKDADKFETRRRMEERQRVAEMDARRRAKRREKNGQR